MTSDTQMHPTTPGNYSNKGSEKIEDAEKDSPLNFLKEKNKRTNMINPVTSKKLQPADHLTIIHEIRNPITAIRLANDAIKELSADANLHPEELNIYTKIITDNIKVIEELIKELLAVKKDKGSKFKLTDIGSIIDDSLRKAEDRIFLKKIKVVKSYQQGMMVQADSEKLSLAFLNIVINATEAIYKNGKIWITVYQSQKDIKVIFKDNGSGMEPEVASRLFTKRYSGKPDGLGIGLIHVKQILDEHEASVSVYSEPGNGTTFLITFKNIE
jgi:signal transduction histidine kinase